jgi:predicted phage tail protein
MTNKTLCFQLYGELGEKYGKEFNLHCSTVRQGLDILAVNFKGFKQHVIDSDKWLDGYEVWAGSTALSPTDEDFALRREGVVIKIVPVIKGASAGTRMVVGTVLYAIGYVLNFTPFAWASPAFYWAGSALIASGVAEKLAGSPKVNAACDTAVADTATSYIFSGAVNNTKQGAAVPIGYGRMMVGSNVISSSFSTVDVPI